MVDHLKVIVLMDLEFINRKFNLRLLMTAREQGISLSLLPLMDLRLEKISIVSLIRVATARGIASA